jgi:decaprenylphospho-beta-D-erythro-pentofuranosid-2-ulose 2-reductase
MPQHIVILGAHSAIAQAVARRFAQRGAKLFLAGRDQTKLRQLASELTTHYAIQVDYGFFDATVFDEHANFWQHVITVMGEIDGVLLAFGYLSDPKQSTEWEEFLKVINCNFTGAVSILNLCADYFRNKKQGFIAAISSVAGDRGRNTNLIYNTAKGALSLYLQGLRQRLFQDGVHVMTIKPGFVDTPMIAGKENLFLVATTDTVADKIITALHKKTNILYVPWFWRYIMWLFKSIPETLFKRSL